MTARLEILNNTRCRLLKITEKVASVIDDALAMEIPGARFNPRAVLWGDGRRHLFSKLRGTFPRGLLGRVKTLLDELKVRYRVRDSRKSKPPRVDLTTLTPDVLRGITLRPYQLRAARRAVKRRAGILWLATNAGKTEVACAIMRVLRGERVLFLVHKKTLLRQARERIAARFGTIEEHIGVIGQGQFDPKHITVATIQSLTRRMPPAKKRIISAYLRTVRVLIVDEGHHTKATTWYRLIQRIDAPYRYILSGTPFGSDNGLLVEAAVGPVIARVSNKELIDLGVSAKPIIRMVECDEPMLKANLGWADVSKRGIVDNDHRNAMIAKEAKRFVMQKKPVLILIRELAHGDNVMHALAAHGVRAAFSHGKMQDSMIDRNKAMFEAGRIQVLVASTIYDEGVDIPDVSALINGDGGQSIRAVLQKLGRGLRKKKTGANTLDLLDFIDLTHPFLAKHSQERLAIYEREGFTVSTK